MSDIFEVPFRIDILDPSPCKRTVLLPPGKYVVTCGCGFQREVVVPEGPQQTVPVHPL